MVDFMLPYTFGVNYLHFSRIWEINMSNNKYRKETVYNIDLDVTH